MWRGKMAGGLLVLVMSTAAQAGDRAVDGSQSLFDAMDNASRDLGRDSGDLQRATQDLRRTPQREAPAGLGPRTAAIRADEPARVTAVLPLQRMPGRGQTCAAQPRLDGFTAGHLPYPAERFAVCLQLARGSQRLVQVRATLVTGRGLVVGKADAQIDFGNRTSAEFAAPFAGVKLPETGTYRYVVDVDGVRVVNRPLFEVRPVAQLD